MLNRKFILSKMSPYLSENNELSLDEFDRLFSSLTKMEQYEIIDMMIEEGIFLIDEKVYQVAAACKVIQEKPHEVDYTDLLHLTNEQLCTMYQNGNKAALEALTEKNKRFVYGYALNLAKKFSKADLTIEDLVQEGMFGLMKAAERFDASLGYSFLTYAGNWIMQSISRAAVDTGFIIRLPVHMFDRISRLWAIRREHPEADDEELLTFFNEGREDPVRIRDIQNYLFYSEIFLNTTSLNTIVGEGEESELGDFIPDENSPSVEETVEELHLQEAVQLALSMLKPKEADVLRLRYGIDCEKGHTLEEVGEMYHVTRERIRQIQAKALRIR